LIECPLCGKLTHAEHQQIAQRDRTMASTNNDKFWTVGTLKSRSWTEALLSELLPKPQYRYLNGKRIRTWRREDVTAAEQSPRYIAAAAAARVRRETEQNAEQTELGPALQNAAAFLKDTWNNAEKPDGPATLLAQRYHEAILKQILTVTWVDHIKPGQAVSYIEHFLALYNDKSGGQPSGELKRFVTAAGWMGRNLSSSQMRKLGEKYAMTLLAIAGRAVSEFTAAQPEANLAGFLELQDFPVQELLTHPLGYVYSVFYVPRAIRTSLEVLVALNPKDEYPEARSMRRHFVLHIGGTNTGKTYAGFQWLKAVKTGVYLAPLRLLALEAQEVLLDGGVDCSLTTGEEEDCREGDTHVAATAEKLNLKHYYDVAVIDECQMISDRVRGYAWTRAILGVLAPEIHLCAAPEAKNILLRIIQSCGDSYEVVTHERKTPLICMDRLVDYANIQPGDALITFSKVGVLSVAEDLRQRGKEPAIIYGALPYSTRRKQVEGFLDGRMAYIVSTDAIGMGLNLPIRRIIFMETEKFDGTDRRELKPEEIQQIAGRAGRYGMYDRGYVGATQDLSVISAALKTSVPPLQHAVTGFSDLVLTVDFDLLEVLEVWNRMPTVEPYMKLDISRYISIISKLRESGFRLTKEQELRAANIPFDETEAELYQLFFSFLRMVRREEPLVRPMLPEKRATQYTLPELELYCRKLDLYFSFSKAFDCAIDQDELYAEREKTADQINKILLHNLKNNIRFCSQCDAALPLHHNGRLCSACFNKRSRIVKHR
jgi:ATP-dependent RNA helicase SUPV3L1/SUV3